VDRLGESIDDRRGEKRITCLCFSKKAPTTLCVSFTSAAHLYG